MKISGLILAKIQRDEFEGEKLINKFRFFIALLYVGVVILFAVLRDIEGLQPFPFYGFIPNNIFLLFSIILFFYLRAKKHVKRSFKYICVFTDITIITVSIYVGCGYYYLDPPISYLSIWALFYSVLILLGAFRYSIRCAVFSGIYAGVCYMAVVFLRANAIDLEYFFELDGVIINLSFPLANESFRAVAMIIAGAITALACKRHLKLFSNMIEAQTNAAKTNARTIEQTHNIAKIIHKSTDKIFLSSKEILATANNQAVSIQEIETTLNENSLIAGEIAEKTSSVAVIAAKTEDDVKKGFNVLEYNVGQLEDIRNKNDSVISGIIALGNKIFKIREVIETINAITDQTKVIAFNAALEAASAREYGRRFSVVSSEVSRLADDITSLTKDIYRQSGEIQKSSSALIIRGRDSAAMISEGNNLIKDLEGIFRKIRYGAEITADQAKDITISSQKQRKSAEQINIAIADISKSLSNFISSTEAATSSAEDLIKMTQDLGDLLSAKIDSKEDL